MTNNNYKVGDLFILPMSLKDTDYMFETEVVSKVVRIDEKKQFVEIHAIKEGYRNKFFPKPYFEWLLRVKKIVPVDIE